MTTEDATLFLVRSLLSSPSDDGRLTILDAAAAVMTGERATLARSAAEALRVAWHAQGELCKSLDDALSGQGQLALGEDLPTANISRPS